MMTARADRGHGSSNGDVNRSGNLYCGARLNRARGQLTYLEMKDEPRQFWSLKRRVHGIGKKKLIKVHVEPWPTVLLSTGQSMKRYRRTSAR